MVLHDILSSEYHKTLLLACRKVVQGPPDEQDRPLLLSGDFHTTVKFPDATLMQLPFHSIPVSFFPSLQILLLQQALWVSVVLLL